MAAKSMPEYKIELVGAPWKRGLEVLKTGDGFALIPPYFKKERTFINPYSIPFYTETVVLFCSDKFMKEKPRHKFPDDFKGAKIGINSGFLLSENLNDGFKNGTFIKDESRNTTLALKKFAANRIDCYANDKISAQDELKKLKEQNNKDATIKNLTLNIATELSKEEVFIGYTAEAKKFPFKADFVEKMNAELEKMKKSGEIDKIMNSAVQN